MEHTHTALDGTRGWFPRINWMHWPAVVCLFLMAAAVRAQTLDTAIFQASLSPFGATEGSGAATLWLRVLRDSNDEILAASLEALTQNKYQRMPPGSILLPGVVHIHRGEDGPVLLHGVLSGAGPTRESPARVVIQMPRPDADLRDALQVLLDDPSEFVFHVHTGGSGDGLRGRLERAEVAVRIGRMRPPYSGGRANGLAAITAIRSSQAAMLQFDVTALAQNEYVTPTEVSLRSIELAESAPAIFSVGGFTSSMFNGDAFFDGVVFTTRDEVESLFSRPEMLYVFTRTRERPDGFMKASLRAGEQAIFRAALKSTGQFPDLAPEGSGLFSKFTVHVIRDEAGVVEGGFLSCHFLGQGLTGPIFAEVHVHRGSEDQPAPLVLRMPTRSTFDSISSATVMAFDRPGGFVAAEKGASVIEGLLANPGSHYLDLEEYLRTLRLAPVLRGPLYAVPDPGVPVVN